MEERKKEVAEGRELSRKSRVVVGRKRWVGRRG
jgi:hypothetical protein